MITLTTGRRQTPGGHQDRLVSCSTWFAATVALSATLIFFGGCTSHRPATEKAAVSSELFEDITQQAGIDFVHQPLEQRDAYFMPRSVGSGAAFLDYDNDGLLDIYLIQNGGSESGLTNRLYRQTASGRFADVTKESGLDVGGYGMGVACGDVNNDGLVDVVLNEYGRTRLMLNRSTESVPHFVDVTAAAALENRMWGTSAAFFDYDRDGWLDLVLVNYVNYDPARLCSDGSGKQDFCGPDAFSGRVTRLFHNLGKQANEAIRFEDVTESSGLSSRPGPGLGVFCADFNGDQWPDVFVANDGRPNHLWINGHDGTFLEEAVTRGLAYNSMGKSEADMGVALGDVDGDGLFDVFVTHLTIETHTLWSQGPPGIFVDRTATSGLTRTEWRGTGFGSAMADLDNDGDLDLLIANGRVARSTGTAVTTPGDLAPFWRTYAERDQVMLNDGAGRFLDASEQNAAMCGIGSVSRGLACGDINNDGHLDALVTHIAGPPALLRNLAADNGHWLTIRAVDPRLNRDAYGAEVYVNCGDRRFMRWINPGYSYMCSNDPRAHFGLGASDRVDSIELLWPDGLRETFGGVDADQQITLRRGEGVATENR